MKNGRKKVTFEENKAEESSGRVLKSGRVSKRVKKSRGVLATL